MDSLEYSDEVSRQVEFLKSKIPPEVARAIGLANVDLRDGPVYLDSEGEAVSCFDEGAARFDFSKACDLIGEWLDSNVEAIQDEIAFDDETGESQYEAIDASRVDIMRELVGRELFPHVH